MTAERDIKRRARERARLTGESYATAKARLATPADGPAAVDEVGRGIFLWLASRGDLEVAAREVTDGEYASRLVTWVAMGLVALVARGDG